MPIRTPPRRKPMNLWKGRNAPWAPGADSSFGKPSSRNGTRVLRACFVYYARFKGSAILYREAKALIERGFEVDLICLRDERKEKIFQTFEGLRVYGIQARPTREKKSCSYFLSLAAFCIKCMVFLSGLALVRRYAIVHVTTPPDLLVFSSLIPKLLGAKVVMDVHDIGPELYMRKLQVGENSWVVKGLRSMERMAAKFADHVITVTDLWKERIVKRSASPSKCSVLLNVPDDQIFTLRHSQDRTKRGTMNIYYHGSLEEHFGIDTLVEAMPKIKELVPLARLHIYGSGRLQTDLEKRVHLHRMEEYVTFHGTVPFYHLPEILKEADLGVVPTKGSVFSDEALSMKSLEYIALGIPIVISRTKAHTTYYDSSMVNFFSPGDEKELATCVANLCNSKGERERFARNAYQFIRQHGWKESKQLYFRIIDRLIGMENPPQVRKELRPAMR